MKELLIPFSIGLTLFLFGLQLMRIGLDRLSGERLQEWLLRFTNTKNKAFFTGIFSTALLQSSSAVTVLTISFVDMGVLTLNQSIGIILGSNIGTTLTTEIITLKVESLSVPMLLLGLAIWFLPYRKVSPIGLAIAGFGCMFLGMETMQWLAAPLKRSGLLDWLLHDAHHPVFMGVLIGTLLTALIQSSSATIAMAMSFLATQIITLPMAIAVVFGSNVGTCVTALIAAIGTKAAARQVALAHLVLNIAGVLLFTPFIPWIAKHADWLANEPTVQIAHIQLLFNVISSLLVLPFVNAFAQLIMRMIPPQPTTISWREWSAKRSLREINAK
jgi:phosphate:Na+ symporter